MGNYRKGEDKDKIYKRKGGGEQESTNMQNYSKQDGYLVSSLYINVSQLCAYKQ